MPKLNGIYSGVTPYVFEYNTSGQLDDFLDSVIRSGDYSSVVNMVMVPSALFDNDPGSCKTQVVDITFPRTLNGYTPRNKKLLTFPYAFLSVDTYETAQTYRYERFPEYREGLDDTGFYVSGCMGPNPEAVIYPKQYEDMGSAGGSDFACQTIGVTMNSFPQCAFPVDAYRAWVAHKSTQAGIQLYGQVLGAVASVAKGDFMGTATSLVGLASTVNSIQQDQLRGSHIQGSQVNSVAVGTRAKNILFKKMSVTREYARTIDDFFDRYGYACERLKKPNLDVRPHWCYTKTKDCTVSGNVPAQFAREIEEIFNKGVTFWKNISEVGNYSLDNSV